MICAQFLWRGTQSAGLGIRKKLRQWYSARSELHSSPELHCRWTAVFSRKLRLQLWRNWRIDLLNVVGSCQGVRHFDSSEFFRWVVRLFLLHRFQCLVKSVEPVGGGRDASIIFRQPCCRFRKDWRRRCWNKPWSERCASTKSTVRPQRSLGACPSVLTHSQIP